MPRQARDISGNDGIHLSCDKHHLEQLRKSDFREPINQEESEQTELSSQFSAAYFGGQAVFQTENRAFHEVIRGDRDRNRYNEGERQFAKPSPIGRFCGNE
jgi:hypothetical protein